MCGDDVHPCVCLPEAALRLAVRGPIVPAALVVSGIPDEDRGVTHDGQVFVDSWHAEHPETRL